MSLWSVIAEKVKEIIKRMIGSRTIEQTLHVTPAISSQMENAIQLWGDMYEEKAPWLHEPTFSDPTTVTSLGLASLIASEKARTALLEFQSEITTPTEEVEVENPDYEEPEPDEFGNIMPSIQPPTITEEKPVSDTKRAEFLNEQYKKLKRSLRKQLEYGIAKGGLVVKPYVVMSEVVDEKGKEKKVGTLEFDFIQADAFYPLAFDASGKITEAAFVQTKAEKDVIYRRLEYHKWQGTKVQVINKAFKSTNNSTNQMADMTGLDLGQEVPLTAVPEWKDLLPETKIGPVDRPLFAYFRMPEANTVDTTSPLGVSGYARAVQLIKDADIQYSTLKWEYEGGSMAIDIDRDALNTVKDSKGATHSVMSKLQNRLYRFVDLSTTGDTYQPFAPSLRDTNYIAGLNTILMRIEDVTGLSRGTISDASAEARTATELKILKQRSYQTNADIQQATEDMLRDAIYIMNVYCDLYKITAPGEYDVNFEWDDSIITDVDAELGKRITLMQNGLTSKLEVRMWYFGETERQAQEALMAVDQESMDAMENEMAIQSQQPGATKPNSQAKTAPKKQDDKKSNDAAKAQNKTK